jgi:hypothetical protein
MHLIPLIKNKILTKTPAVQSLSLDDKLVVNLDYKSNMMKNKINVLVSKKEKESENNKTSLKIDDDRRFIIDSCIMKVMKRQEHSTETNNGLKN